MHHLDKQFPIDYAFIHKKSELAQFLCAVDEYTITENYDFQRAANAAGWPDATYLKILFERIPLFVKSDKSRLLATAVNANNLEGATFLISQGAQADARMCVNAALHENKQMLEELCKAGVSLKEKDASDINPLRDCFYVYNSPLSNVVPVKLLLEAGAAEPAGAIHCIAGKYLALPLKQALLRVFRDNGVKLDTPDASGSTLLHHTSGSGADECDDTFMFYLLDLGANPNIADKDGITPFMLFCRSNRNPEKLRRFIETYQPDLNTEDKSGNTPLINAASQGKKAHALIAHLLNYHADIKKSRDGMLHRACTTLNVELAQSLIQKYGANAKQINQGITTLMKVVTAHNFSPKKQINRTKIEDARMRLIDLLMEHGVEHQCAR